MVTLKKKNDYSLVDDKGKTHGRVIGGRLECAIAQNNQGYIQSIDLETAKQYMAVLQLFIATEEADVVAVKSYDSEVPF